MVPGPQDPAGRMLRSSEGYLLLSLLSPKWGRGLVALLHQPLVPLARRADPPDSTSLRPRA